MASVNFPIFFVPKAWSLLWQDSPCLLQIFTGEESDVARNLDRQAVLVFLRSHCVAAVIPFLVRPVFISNSFGERESEERKGGSVLLKYVKICTF